MTPKRRRAIRRTKYLRTRARKELKRRLTRRRGNRQKWINPDVARAVSGEKITHYENTRLAVPFPENFAILEEPEQASVFFESLRDSILIHPRRSVMMDHSTIKAISPEAGLVLIAELFRADHYAPRCKKMGNKAADPLVAEVLQKIGYWQYFGIEYHGPNRTGRQFLIHKTGRRTSGAIVKDVIEHISEVAAFTESEKQRLFEAFIECMDNVMNHAYPNRHIKPPVLVGQWWLLAYRDSTTKEVWLCFYDQGAGIPFTIRTRLWDMFTLTRPTDSNLIVKAVTEGSFSKHDLPNRGNGLPTLKALVDEARDGELAIISQSGYCIFPHGREPITKILTRPFAGTLIVWKLCR